LVLEEFGMARDGWTATDGLDPAAPTTGRDSYFSAIYAAVEAAMGEQQALGGDSFWAWAGEARPPSLWTGDPPHEPPGWYSVYETDTTTVNLVADHALNVSGYAQPL
jgi:mannan endo-1,4-beta-mannosidase